jgi:hypothetical protein
LDSALDGTVTAVATDRLDFSIGDEAWSMHWVGAPLEPAFAVGDALKISAQADDPHGMFGMLPPAMRIVRSARATAVTIVARTFHALETSPGSTAQLPTLAGMPTLDYSLTKCCNGVSAEGATGIECDYSALSASFNGTSTPIAFGQTGTVGPWSVTNIDSSYSHGVEYSWTVDVTMLGPGAE